ncbi:MAG: polysaccharide biosynthesis C-terminal domain-containing protein, partial [bacterium]
YNGAYRIIQLPMAAFYSLTASAFPVLTQLAEKGNGAVTRVVRPFVPVALGLGLAAALGLWAFREALIRLLYGPGFGPAVPVLSVLAFAVPLDFLVALKGTSYIARRQERLAFFCVAGAALANVLANLILIPTYGIIGSAWATVGAYVILLAFHLLFLDRRLARDARVSG